MLDVLLISEAHMTDRVQFRLSGYTVYSTHHPDGTAHAGTALIIKNSIRHYQMPDYKTEHIQATSVAVECWQGSLTISAVYCPPKHKIDQAMFTNFLHTLGNRFIAGGDWNAKHLCFGSRLTTTRGRELKKSVDHNRLITLSTSLPTYWPTDPNKTPDLLDFFILGGISTLYTSADSCLDSSSDHTPIIASISTSVIERKDKVHLSNRKTDWGSFRAYICKNINLKMPLKTNEDIEDAARYITNLIQVATWKSTPSLTKKCKSAQNYPLEVKKMVLEKRRLRRVWHTSRHPADKTSLNIFAEKLKHFIKTIENETTQHQLESLSPHLRDSRSLWKATKHLDQPQKTSPPLRLTGSGWARSDDEKAETFALFLKNVFTPNEVDADPEWEAEIKKYIASDHQMSPPIKLVTPAEVQRTIRRLESNKAPGFDLITANVLKELPKAGFVYLTTLFNSILRMAYYPSIWKVSQIVMIPKPGKPPNVVSSYRPISLLPVLSKLFEKLFKKRMKLILEANNLIPNHQFGFRTQHSTVEQVHRVTQKIRQTLENKEYCSAAYLDVQQAFDKVWHEGLLYKLKKNLPHNVFAVIKSYLENRIFQVKVGEAHSSFHEVHGGVPQGSVLGPVLYTLFTADLPETNGVLCATFADDTAALASDKNPNIASQLLQTHLNKIERWLQRWKIKVSATKSNHVTYTLRRENCPCVSLGNEVLPHKECVKYLGMYLDRRQTWKEHIKRKKMEISARVSNMDWLLGRKSRLNLNNKLLIYKSIIKPVWTYGIQLWGTASNSSIEVLQRMQNKILRKICNAPWFTRNVEVHEYLNMPTVKEELRSYSQTYKQRLRTHVNKLATELLHRSAVQSRLKRPRVMDLDSRL